MVALYTNKEDLWKLNASMREHFTKSFFDEPVTRYGINITSGTSGGKPLMVASRYPDAMYKRFSCLERSVIAMGSMAVRLSQAVFFGYGKTSNHAKALFLDTSDIKQGEGLNRVIKDFKPDGVFGFPSFIVQFFQNVTHSSTREQIKVIGFIGECLSAQKEKILQEAAPNAKIVGVYGNAELGAISKELGAGESFSCKFLERNHYHPNDDDGVEIEIVNPDENGVGEVAISLRGFLYPVYVKHYLTGDAGRIIDKKCPCGNPLTFELLGRKGLDYIKLAGALLIQEEFDRVMSELSTYICDYRLMAREITKNGNIVGEVSIQIIPTEKLREMTQAEKWIAQKISSLTFVTPTRTLSEVINHGFYTPLSVSFVDNFPYQHKGIKLRYIT